MAGSRRLVGFVGEWAGAAALIARDPVRVADPAATIEALRDSPAVADSRSEAVGGGWFGWIEYDGSPRLAFYDHVLRLCDGVWFFECLWTEREAQRLIACRDALASLLAGRAAAPRGWTLGRFAGSGEQTHLAAVERAIEQIRAGEFYQANICTRLRAEFTGDPVAFAATLLERLRPRFGGFLDAGDRYLVAASPELFLRRRGRDVWTSPIKGTWPVSDRLGAQRLRAAPKDRAENVMIVDLMRNDLGRVCEVGTVRPVELLGIQRHPGVWHLVSTVTGRLRATLDDVDLVSATFPPGSVTGAPKARAVEAIAELERADRGAFTGAFGLVSPAWGTELAVTIRSFEMVGSHVALGVGGGVTADSVPMREWRECLHKAQPLLSAVGAELASDLDTAAAEATAAQLAGGVMETILVRDGVPIRLADHLRRLRSSVSELYGIDLGPGWEESCLERARRCGPGRWVLRLWADGDGRVRTDAAPAPPRPPSSAAVTVRRPPGLWRHKWAEREALAAAEARGRTPVFVADDGCVLETSRGNLFLLRDGVLVTPPLRDDLLPGVTRRALLDLARDEGVASVIRPFGVAELCESVAFWTSSLSGAVPIRSIDGRLLPRLDPEVARFAARLTSGGAATVR